MAFFRSERGIGRGEIAESHVEVPLFAAFMLVASFFLFVFYFRTGNQSLTLALAISMLVFGITVVRVEFGVYVLVLSMLLSPEIEGTTDLTGERPISLRYDDLLIIVIFLGVMVKLAFEGRFRLWQPSPVNSGIVVYYGICVISTVLAYQRDLGAWDERSAFFVMLKMLEYYLLFFLVGHAIRGPIMLRRQMLLFFAVAAVVSAYGIYTIRVEPRVSAPFETGGTEPNTLGGYLTIVICIAMGLFTQARRAAHRWVFLCIAGLAFVPFLYTLSRASYVALFVGLTALSIVSRKWIIFVGMVLLVFFSALVMPAKVIERVQSTFDSGSGREVSIAGQEITLDKSSHERIEIWRKVGFILTIGPVYALLGGGVSWETVLDSQFARVILETGLLGLAAFAFLQFMILKTMREAYRWTEDWYARGLAMGAFVGAVALNVHALGTISFLIVRIMEPFWFLVALSSTIRNEALAHHIARARARLAKPAPAVPPKDAAPPKDVAISAGRA